MQKAYASYQVTQLIGRVRSAPCNVSSSARQFWLEPEARAAAFAGRLPFPLLGQPDPAGAAPAPTFGFPFDLCQSSYAAMNCLKRPTVTSYLSKRNGEIFTWVPFTVTGVVPVP